MLGWDAVLPAGKGLEEEKERNEKSSLTLHPTPRKHRRRTGREKNYCRQQMMERKDGRRNSFIPMMNAKAKKKDEKFFPLRIKYLHVENQRREKGPGFHVTRKLRCQTKKCCPNTQTHGARRKERRIGD